MPQIGRTGTQRPPGLKLSISRPATGRRGSVLIALAGELDMATAGAVDRTLRCTETTAQLVVLDLRSLEFMDSSGAHLILDADRRIRRTGRRLLVTRSPGPVERLFALTGLDRELADEPLVAVA